MSDANSMSTPKQWTPLERALYEALASLTNEASGFVVFADPATHGNTNIAVLRERIEQARAALRLATEGAPK